MFCGRRKIFNSLFALVLMDDKRELFLKVFRKAQKKYGNNSKRLAGESWKHDWQTLLATICSAQNRDEVTIPVCEEFFAKFNTLEKIAGADEKAILKAIRRINYCESKAKYLKKTARILIDEYGGKVPSEIDGLVKLPGVGRKTANLVITEIHKKPGITVDTHVHRISNVVGLVETKTPHETELALMKIAPRHYWGKINRLFVLWGKEVPGRDKEKLLKKLEEQ